MELLEQLRAALGEQYRVERELGRGGMAVVFLAQDLKHHRPVAIKLLKPELSAAIGSDRFAREIEIAATLQHPHILPLFDSGNAAGLLYYVMPFVEGESLRQRLAREPQLPLDAALQITREVGSALAYAHDHGVVHRDIKPENIMVSDGQAVVADFGVARALAATAEPLTSSGMVVGTPHYMSPEQSSGATVDGRSDQYSLACTLYEMLIGEPPFGGPTFQAVMARHSVEPVPSLRVVRQTVPQSLEEAIVRAMAKVPADRFASMQRFLDALQAPASAAAQTADTTQVRGRTGTRGRGVLSALGAGVLAIAAVWWLVAGRGGVPSDAVTAVAVLPFQDPAGDTAASYLADGMTEGLIADLSQIRSLKIISRQSGAVAQGAALSLAALASDLGVEAVVKGSIRRVSDTVRVNVRLLRAPDSTLLFARDYQTDLGGLPELQRDIAMSIGGTIGAKLDGNERSRLSAHREVDRRAYDAYLRGRFSLEQGELAQALALFEEASPNRARVGPALCRTGQLLHVAPVLRRRLSGGSAPQGPIGSGARARSRRVAGGGARGQRLHPGLLRVGLAHRRAGVQTRPRAPPQLRRRVLLLQPLPRVAPAARRSDRADSAGPWHSTPCHWRSWRIARCSTTSRVATTRPTGG